jgi:hypothetical protein
MGLAWWIHSVGEVKRNRNGRFVGAKLLLNRVLPGRVVPEIAVRQEPRPPESGSPPENSMWTNR